MTSFTATLACRRILAAVLALVCFSACGLRAQDRLVFRDNHVEEGKVVGMNNGAVVIKVPAGELSYNLGLLTAVEVAPPASFQPGYAAYQAGEWDRALAALRPIVEQYKGLPTRWANDALAAVGDIYVEKNDFPRAMAAYNDLRTLYPSNPGGSLRLYLAQARIAFAQNNFPAAEKLLRPLQTLALKQPAEANNAQGAAYGRACDLLGEIEERKGSYQAALVDYLQTVTLFYEDATVRARAQKSADALLAAHPELSVP